MTAEPTIQTTSETASAAPLIRKTGVLGSGTMGARIAAHFANAGLPVVLLDLASEQSSGRARSAIAQQALEALKRSKPAAFYDPSLAAHITAGNFEDDLPLLASCDWIVEAVTENLAIKQALLEKAAPHLKPGAILTTNTSGIPIESIGAVLPSFLRPRFFGTHFFNPPRYMRLVEIIAPPGVDRAAVEAVSQFAGQRLGKEVVFARDTPNFIANRIGVFIMLEAVRLMESEDLTIEEVDALTGAAIGWPRTGTFRLADLVGLDVMAHVASNFARIREGAAAGMAMPAWIQTMLERRWLGDKTGQGFYKKVKGADGAEQRLALDWKTLEYHPAAQVHLPSIEMAKNAERLPDRIRTLLSGDVEKDKAARFHWRLLSALWNYSADCLPEIADDASAIDRAMRAGFNWEMGPFELWDAAGVPQTVARMPSPSRIVRKLLDCGATSWYRGHDVFDPASASYIPIPRAKGIARVADFRASHGVVKSNAGASLVDLGDGVACIELHSPKDAIGADIVTLLTETLRPDGDAVRNFEAFVIGGDSAQFSVGANLMQLLLAAQEEEWDEIDLMIRSFQRSTQLIKFCPRPVVAAPFGLCLGGGAEIAMHAARRQAHAELYIGLVETGVGLLPGGGGCKEMTLRSESGFDALRKNFETVTMARVSTSALEARGLGFLSAGDRITMNRDRLLWDAKHLARAIADAGYAPPVPRAEIPAPGEAALANLKLGIYLMREGEFISDHDVKVATRVAHVLCGGPVTPGTPVSEPYLLDLEREAFLSLCGEKKTQDRIAFTLKTGKPLRN